MTDAMPTFNDIRQTWKADLQPMLCERCSWSFLAPAREKSDQCPHCHQPGLSIVSSEYLNILYPFPPEQVVPFRISPQALEESIGRFAAGIPYPPEGLNPSALKAHLIPIYLPLWLVDAQVQATWQAESGFDYEVISHQDTYDQDGSGWKSQEVKETRVRWENRTGTIQRLYQNITAPALDDAANITAGLGNFPTSQALPYDPGCLGQAFVRIPDHSPDEAWNEAVQSFTQAASEECRQACAANHLRQFRWKAKFQHLNWTLMLLPVYTSFYTDDAGQPQPVMIHGQSGQLTGARRSSTRRAWNTSLVFLLTGIILFLVGLILDGLTSRSTMLSGLSMILILLGIVSAIGSFIPIISSMEFNRKQKLR